MRQTKKRRDLKELTPSAAKSLLAQEPTMPTKPTAADARVHVPRLVLRHHLYEKIHGAGVLGRINTHLAVRITKTVGSMWCAYLFALLAVISLPAAIRSHDPIIIVA